ncbi:MULTISPECIES: hypothetical protein [Novosphingobium]|jgi:hypothetical protein|uniref:Uncharacterized protein n=1 Tax=Novosphingobium subterraneum TaxID=48936 RepID=A0A0B8Z741_9SPHN|nr:MULTISPECIES: hypothetical protein [Novosphingobium]KHS42009.1 hypothetical protein NJ75_04375 [Novosphingobium subterraneum]QOV96334.1 hypothetical protein IM701_18765 [Novosphingobium sp. ES2-1]
MAWSYRIIDHGHYFALHAVEEGSAGELLQCSSKPIDFAFDAAGGPDKVVTELEMALKAASKAPVLPMPQE